MERVGRTDNASREARARFAFLAVASRVLADSLDYETTLVTVAGLALPHLGAWCIVDLLEPDGSIRRLAVLHPDPAKQALARDLHLYPPDPSDAFGAPRVMRTGRPEIVHGRVEDFFSPGAGNPKQRAVLRELGSGAFLTVPMVARGRMVGAITFTATDAEVELDELDVLLAEDLARRCALAIDNASLYAEAHAARDAAESARVEAQAAREAAERAHSEMEAVAKDAAEVNERLLLATLREQELTEEAQAASRAKSDFLSNMSHEVRTPLNAIIAFADLLELEISGPITETQRVHLGRIKAASGHLLTLIDDILDLAKVEAGRLMVRRESASASQAISDSVELVGTMATAAGVEIEVAALDGDGPFYLGDEQRVRQILVNLLSNAVKFTPSGGHVSVTGGSTPHPDPEANVDGEGPWTYIRVEDTGIGIAPDQCAEVFRPFVQVQTGHNRTRGGTGLGLAIARDLAGRMGGDLTLHSELGVGSRFTLWLPAAPPADSGRGS